MQYLQGNIEFTVNSKDLTPNEKLEAIQNELLEDSYYNDDGNIYWEGNLANLDIELWEEMYNTNLPIEYMEAGIDAGLREFVRLVHANAQCDVTQEQLDNFDNMSDVMSINTSPKNKQHFYKAWKTCEWDTLIISEMFAAPLVTNKRAQDIKDEATCPFSYLSNFFEEAFNSEECTNDDVINANRVSEYISKKNKQEHQMKMLRKEIRILRTKYKKCYDNADKLAWTDRGKELKKEWDKFYKEFLHYSKAMDKIKELDAKIELGKKQSEADELLHLFVMFQQACPDKYLESISREDIKAKYKSQWYEVTRYYLKRLLARIQSLKETEEEETA